MQINFVYDSSVSNAPSGFITALNAAAEYLDNLIINPITVTIQVGWQEVDGGPLTGNEIGAASLAGVDELFYSQLRSDLAANATSAADQTAIASLPSNNPTNSAFISISYAQEKALGLLAPNSSEVDGYVGFGGPVTFNFDPNNRAVPGEVDFVGVAEHELTHALGRMSAVGTVGPPQATALDLFRYSAPGVRQLTTGPAYFSIDGGQTNLDPYDTVSDTSDWASSVSGDAFDATAQAGVENVLTQADITELNVLGFTMAGSPLPFVISGTRSGQTTLDTESIDPFSGVTIRDGSASPTETVVINVVSPANGTLTNLDGGSYNAGTGVYSVSGSVAAVTAAVDDLQFVPTFQQTAAGKTVTTNFILRVSNAAGMITTDTTTQVIVTAIPDFPSFLTVTAGNNGFIASYNMDTQANATLLEPLFSNISTGVTNGSILSAISGTTPTIPAGKSGLLQVFNSGQVTLPVGYVTALVETSSVSITGGSANGQLVAANQGGLSFFAGAGAGSVFGTGGNNLAVVGSTGGSQFIALGGGSNTINVAGGNNTISGGNGSNLIFLGAGQNVVTTTGIDTVDAGTGSAAVSMNGANSLVFGNLASNAGSLNVALGGAQSTISAGNSASWVTTTGANDLVLGSFGATSGGLNELDTGLATSIFAANFGAAATLDGANALICGDFTSTPGALTINDGGLSDTITAANSALSATLGGAHALLFGGYGTIAGTLNVADAGIADTVSAGNSALTASLDGSGALLFGGYGDVAGTLSVTDNGSNDTIAAGNSNMAITASGSSSGLFAYGGTGTLNFVGGAGTATVMAGSGASSVTGGTGGTVLLGSAGSNIALAGSNSVVYAAGAGNETLNGTGSSGSNVLAGGSDADVIFGGSGSDTLFAGAGAETLAGGGGSDVYSFVSSLTHGSADVILDFTSADMIYLSGYGANDAATALANASSSNGNTVITLADNTQVTFLNVASAGALQGHVFSS